jgi:E3 ubiquitin-protein ligase makorin
MEGGESYYFGAVGTAPAAFERSGAPRRTPRPAAADARQECRFFARGACRNGNGCRFAHITSSSGSVASTGSDEAQMAEIEAALAGSSIAEIEATLVRAKEEEGEAALDLAEARQSWTAACSICMELPARQRKRFGCLNACNHAFCLSCIRSWRDSRAQSRNAVLVCPVCRVLSTFVVPSLRHVTHPVRKARLIDAYRRNLKQIDCVHYAGGSGVCPFGSACHYAHRASHGGGEQRAQRVCLDADGKMRVSAPKVSLLDYAAKQLGGRRRT